MNCDVNYKYLEDLEALTYVLPGEPMKNHTSFRIGGPADYFTTPKNIIELKNILLYCKDKALPYLILGNGSNILVRDSGYRGAVIYLGEGFKDITAEGEMVTAGAGAKLSKVAKICLKNDLSGMEGLSGIPGSVGGAFYMNAGAYGYEIENVAYASRVIDANGTLLTINRDEMDFGYRKSIFEEKKYIIIDGTFALHKGNYEDIESLMRDYTTRRQIKQPLSYPSAGSVFKRPEGFFAGKLIEDAGLKGYTIGGAQVSLKHAGFIVNIGNATAEDVLNLINHIIETVNDKFGVILQPEVKIIGE